LCDIHCFFLPYLFVLYSQRIVCPACANVQSHLLFKLADEADGKGRRGRKRKSSEADDDDKDKEVDDGREVEREDHHHHHHHHHQVEREDRAKQREMMKEMRARRAAEKLVEAKFGDEVSKQRSRAKQVGQCS